MKFNKIRSIGLAGTLALFLSTNLLQAQDSLAQEKTKMMEEVTVKGRKRLIEISKGKTVLNVQASALTSGASALDLLRKLPGVSLGQEEEIFLRGTAGVNVMVDGKMTYLSGKQLVSMLQSMSAENINRIELLTAPPAEFDAAGNAGIIHIVTKKRTALGYAIDLRSAVSRGRYWMVNENLTASLNTTKFNIYGSFDYNRPRRVMRGKSSNTLFQNSQPLLLSRRNEHTTRIDYYTYRLGMDWKVAPRQTLTLDYNGYLDDFRMDKRSQLQFFHPDRTLHRQLRSSNRIIEPYYYDAVNLGYRLDLDSTGKNLTTNAHYISYRNLSDGQMDTEPLNEAGLTNGPLQQLRFHQPGFIRIGSLKADLELPLKSIWVKGGLKYSTVSNNNRYRFDSLQGSGYVEAEGMSNRFRYQEQIGAAYASVSRKWKRTVLDAGLRLEHTSAQGYTVKQDVRNRWSYTRLFPSLSLDHELDANNKWNLSVSRRINRPSYSELNPVRWYNDPYFYYSGNPNLVPEMAWIFSGAYTLRHKYVATASYGRRNHFLTRQLVVDEASQAIKSQSANFRQMKRLDLEVSVPIDLSSWWNLQLTSGFSHTTYPISVRNGFRDFSQWAGQLQLQQQLKLPGKIQVEISSYASSNELLGIYRKGKVFWTDAGFKRSFFQNKLAVQLSLSDLFQTNRYVGVSLTDLTDYRYEDRPDSRRIGLSLRYHIGGKLTSKRDARIDEQDRL